MKRWIKRISFMILCFMTIFTIYSHTVKVTAAEGTETIVFTGTTNKTYSSSNFTVSFNENRTDGSLFTDDVVTITALNNVYISSIKVYGEIDEVLQKFKVSDGVVSYRETKFNMDTMQFEYVEYVETYSLVEYINAVTSTTFKALEDAVISRIEITYTTKPKTYVIFNLAAGNITFTGNVTDNNVVYEGYGINKDSEGNFETITGTYTANYNDNSTSKIFYVIQTEIDSNGNIVRYNEPIDNYNISYNYKSITDIVLDNIWSSYCSSDGINGGIHIPTSGDTIDDYRKRVTLRLKGINRFARISYWTGGDRATAKSTCFLKFTSFSGDGSTDGALVAIGKQTLKNNDVHGKLAINGWHSVIGGSDGSSRVTGLEIAGGTILAVATAKDQCTAIGAGGNGYADIKITGGKVTAISYTTGTAIGGGIGHKAAGGRADIKIIGGEVHAYNLGQPYKHTFEPSKVLDVADFVPGTAIGSGSSYLASGASSNITLEGGKVYAYSNGGSGLGGGNSIQSIGGSTTINITEGDITSYGYIPDKESLKITTIMNALQTQILSKITNGGIIISSTINPFNYGSNGAGIGGGSGQVGNGGSATITINGGYLDASSIGGGNSKEAKGASATVNVNGGTIRCETIGGGFSDANGFADGTVTVKGGSLNATMSALPTNGLTSEMLYLTRISVLKNDERPIIKGMIESLDIDNADYYSTSHMYTDEEGMIYLWLPKSAAVRLGQITYDSMSSRLDPWEEADGVIGAYEIGILKVIDSDSYNYYVNTVTSEYYHLYNEYDSSTDVLSKELENTTIVPNNTLFSIYIDVLTGYTINAYYAVESSSGKKTFEKAITSTIKENKLYSLSITITQNTSILFEIMGPANIPHYFIMDLYNGNINITEGSTGYIIEQNGYVLTGYNGDIYATSGGIATSNNISVEIEDDSEIGLFLNNIIIGSDDYCVGVHSGKVNLTTGSVNDIIHSNNNSAIFVEENAVIEITTDEDDALQLYSGDKNISPISGKGKVIFNNQGGYFQIKTDGNIPQISVGIYEVNGKGSFSAELFIDEFEFELIGYIDSLNNLHSVAEAQTGNYDDFAARGIYKVLNGVEVTSQKVENNKFYITISTSKSDIHDLGVIELTCNNNTILENNGYTIIDKTDDTCTIVIDGETFKNGNIMIFAAVVGVIPYQIIAYKGIYDAAEHTITVAVNTSQFNVYYSTVELDLNNYKENGSNNAPTFKDVTEIRIYVFIIYKADDMKMDVNDDVNDFEFEYIPKSDSSMVSISKGTNEWVTNLVCPDVAYGYTPNPSASAKWGNENIKYNYYESDETQLADSFDFTQAKLGYYYVEAIIEGNGNYDTIKTIYKVKFNIIEIKTFTSTSRSFTKVSGTSSSLNIKLDGEFTVLYSITYAEGLKLRIGNTIVGDVAALPIGTKITFIDFPIDANNSIKYYYYVIKEADVVDKNNILIPLTSFIEMGTNNNQYQAPDNGSAVLYQFSVDFEKNRTANAGELRFTLSDNSSKGYDVVNVTYSSNSIEEITFNKVSTDNKVTYDLTINADDSSANKILAIKLLGNNLDELDGLNVELYNNGRLVNAGKIINGMYFYNLGIENISNKTYQLAITNLFTSSKDLDVEFDIRNSLTEVYYCLENKTSNNHKTDSVELLKYQQKQIDVTITPNEVNNESVVTEDNAKLYVTINSSSYNIDLTLLQLVLYMKTSNGYVEYILEEPLTVQMDNDESLYILLPELRNNTYKIEFKYQEAQDHIYFIVNKS